MVEEIASLLEFLAAAFVATDEALPVALCFIVNVVFDLEVGGLWNELGGADFMEDRFTTKSMLRLLFTRVIGSGDVPW